MKNQYKYLAVLGFAFLCPMMLGGILGLTGGVIKYIEWILYWTGNVSLIVAIIASFGAGASVVTAFYGYLKNKKIKWIAAW